MIKMNKSKWSTPYCTDTDFSNKQFLLSSWGPQGSSQRNWNSNVLKRDMMAAKAGFAVEFPLVCARLSASVIPEVLVEDDFGNVSKPEFPLHGDTLEASSSEMETWMSRAQLKPVEISMPPPNPFSSALKSLGSSTYSLPPEPQCAPSSPVVRVVIDPKTHLLKSFKMRGFLADEKLIEALGLCLQYYPSFQTIEFEKCGLTAKTLELLAHHLREAGNICAVHISENPIPEQNFNTLLRENNALHHLSLQKCEITDVGAKLIASELTFHDLQEQNSLYTLDLSSNKIGDEGVHFVADAMRTNRTLKKLVLSKNNIGDTGAEEIASVAMKFALKSEELKFRNRRSIMRRRIKEKTISEMQSIEDATASEITSSRRILRGKKSNKRVRDSSNKELTYDQHPYVWDARPDGPNLWCVGNVSLQSLCLSYNNIGVKGVKKILAAIQYQNQLKKAEGRPHIGFWQVELEGNPIPPGLGELNRIQEVLSVKMREDKVALHKAAFVEPTSNPRPVTKSGPERYSPYMGYFAPNLHGKTSDDLKGKKAVRIVKGPSNIYTK